MSSTTNGPRRRVPNVREASSSLYDELFPEEKTSISKSTVSTDRDWEKLPPFEWAREVKSDNGKHITSKKEKGWFNSVPPSNAFNSRVAENVPRQRRSKDEKDENLRHSASVLVLNCASKSLEESDFFRLSPKGEHLEGWTSGIIKGMSHNELRPMKC